MYIVQYSRFRLRHGHQLWFLHTHLRRYFPGTWTVVLLLQLNIFANKNRTFSDVCFFSCPKLRKHSVQARIVLRHQIANQLNWLVSMSKLNKTFAKNKFTFLIKRVWPPASRFSSPHAPVKRELKLRRQKPLENTRFHGQQVNFKIQKIVCCENETIRRLISIVQLPASRPMSRHANVIMKLGMKSWSSLFGNWNRGRHCSIPVITAHDHRSKRVVVRPRLYTFLKDEPHSHAKGAHVFQTIHPAFYSSVFSPPPLSSPPLLLLFLTVFIQALAFPYSNVSENFSFFFSIHGFALSILLHLPPFLHSSPLALTKHWFCSRNHFSTVFVVVVVYTPIRPRVKCQLLHPESSITCLLSAKSTRTVRTHQRRLLLARRCIAFGCFNCVGWPSFRALFNHPSAYASLRLLPFAPFFANFTFTSVFLSTCPLICSVAHYFVFRLLPLVFWLLEFLFRTNQKSFTTGQLGFRVKRFSLSIRSKRSSLYFGPDKSFFVHLIQLNSQSDDLNERFPPTCQQLFRFFISPSFTRVSRVLRLSWQHFLLSRSDHQESPLCCHFICFSPQIDFNAIFFSSFSNTFCYSAFEFLRMFILSTHARLRRYTPSHLRCFRLRILQIG